MRNEVSSPLAQVVARLDRARRRYAARGTGPRWAFGAAGVVALVAIAYAASPTNSRAGGFVRSGEKFSADDLIVVRNALDAKGLRFGVTEAGKVEVAAERLDEANGIVAKLAVGRQPLAAIERKPLEFNPWDPLTVNDERKVLALNERIAAMIRPFDGIVSAHVNIIAKKSRGLRPTADATAFVYLQTENDRELSGATLDSILMIVTGNAPDVKPGAVSVCDVKGRIYADPLNPALSDRTHTRTYRDELRQEIEKNLDWLRGAKVSVQVSAPPPIAPASAPLATPAAEPSAEGVGVALPSMGVNQPLDLTGESAPAPALPPVPIIALAPVPAPAASVELSGPPRVRVLVEVPRSYYLNAFPRREPSAEELRPLVERTKVHIETAVRHVVPADHLDVVEIIPIADEAPLREPAAPPGSRSDLIVWVPVGVAVGTLAAVLLVALRVVAGRRPAPMYSTRAGDGRGRYKIDEPSDSGPGPGPSERVRELIRLSPEAAASVLNRWTQGGTNG